MTASTEWKKLCDAYDLAVTDVALAWLPVQQKFAAVAVASSAPGPTEDELKRLEVARHRQSSAQRRMDVFARLHLPMAIAGVPDRLDHEKALTQPRNLGRLR